MSYKRKRVVMLIVAVTIIAISALLYPFVDSILGNPFNNAKFVQTTWLTSANNDQSNNPRGPMAEDLMSNYLRVGKTRHDVHELLGKSDNSIYDETQNIDRYFLGYWGRMSIDGDYLIIHYDRDTKLKSSELYVH